MTRPMRSKDLSRFGPAYLEALQKGAASMRWDEAEYQRRAGNHKDADRQEEKAKEMEG